MNEYAWSEELDFYEMKAPDIMIYMAGSTPVGVKQ